jgi:transposase
MVRELDADYEAELLFPARMEDWIGPRHIARFVREFVGMLDLASLGFATRTPKSTGRPGLTARLILSAWIYGYLTRQRSTRNLERACKSDIGAIWLTGNHQPDHSTLHTYFQEHKTAFKKLLKESALLACRMGLVDMNFVAVDGTKLKASTAFRESVVAKDMEIALAFLDSEIDRYVADIDAAGDTGCAKLPEALGEVKKLREAIARDLTELMEIGASILSPVDPDARMMQTRDGTRPAYNAQAAVDSKFGIVLACSVTTEANDSGQLNPVIDLVEENVGLTPDLTGIDTGYFAADQIQIAENKGRNIDVAMRGREKGPPFTLGFLFTILSATF